MSSLSEQRLWFLL